MIVHLIVSDKKFINGYIKFMVCQFPEYQHAFFALKDRSSLERIDGHLLIGYHPSLELITNYKYVQILKAADKIIVSGSWISTIGQIITFLIHNEILCKTYFQFWGGDFYSYRKTDEKIINVKNRIKNILRQVKKPICSYMFRNAAGLIFLIDGEYEKFQEIMHISNRNFVAPMPGDSGKIINVSKYRTPKTEDVGARDGVNIIIGNSATPTNQHREAFKLLEHYKKNSMKIYCPLSYGDKSYGKEIAQIGTNIFGNIFYPIFDFIEKEKYIEFLSTMDIGIFYNNRQQAMGNINIMLSLGKKIYLRKTTSMWYNYRKIGYNIYSADEIANMSFADFSCFNSEELKTNIRLSDYDKTEKAKRAWHLVLDSTVKKNS